ncbi:MAG: hypothetical protein O6946_05420 [Gammaproteobacteria bacterium]|nr:hypothetical protein [Gammaproteobacteria bacterium]
MKNSAKHSQDNQNGIQNAVGWSMISIFSILVTVWFALAYKIPENTFQVSKAWRPWGCPAQVMPPVELRITPDGSYILEDQHVSLEHLEAEIRVASSYLRAKWAPLLLRPTADSPAGALVKAITIGQELGMQVVVGVPLSENEIPTTNSTRQPCKSKRSS